MYYVLLILFSFVVVSAHGKALRYKEIESDIRIPESLYDELYKGDSEGRKLGSVGEGEIMGYWRHNYTNGQFIIPVTLLEDDDEEGPNSLTPESANEIFTKLESMASKLGDVIKFVRYDGIDPKPEYYVKIGNFGSGCWSYVGKIPLEYQPQQLNIGNGCLFTDTVEHEMMHALGFFHEQARPDRDDHVVIHWDNIDPEKYINFNKATEINSRGSPYDYESIMHYTSTAFAINYQLPTISVKDPNLNVVLGGATTMTDIDQEQLRLLYRCETSVRDIANNCIVSCPCRLNEGNCSSHDQCEGNLNCVENRCQDVTLSPTSPIPTKSPTSPSPSPTSVPTSPPVTPTSPSATPTSPPVTVTPSSDNYIGLIIALCITIGFFGLVLIVNII